VFETSGLRRRDLDSTSNLYLRDRRRRTTTLISHTLSGHPCRFAASVEPPQSSNASMSRDGSLVAFDSTCTHLNARDTNDRADVFVWHRRSGVISLVTRAARDGFDPAISADGRYVVYDGESDAHGNLQLDSYDRATHHTSLVTVGPQGDLGNGDSRFPAVSGRGKYMVFYSSASNLVARSSTRMYTAPVSRERSASRDRRPMEGPTASRTASAGTRAPSSTPRTRPHRSPATATAGPGMFSSTGSREPRSLLKPPPARLR
jgi:hypothetical protein